MAIAILLLAACGQGQGGDAAAVEPAVITEPDVEVVRAAGPGVDPDSGLIIDDNWELVKGHCTACHSAQLVTQNRGDRHGWLYMIRWMQETQGLWPFDDATEKAILDYLAKNYAPSALHRRPPLPDSMLPPNPHSES